MKFLITFFALIYSSYLFAGDNLDNKSIICSKITEDKEIDIFAYYFKGKKSVWIYKYDEEEKEFLVEGDGKGKTLFYYETTLSKIKIKEWLNEIPYIEINRETLQVTLVKALSNEIMFEGNSKNCSVYSTLENEYIKEELNNIYQKLKKEVTKENKI